MKRECERESTMLTELMSAWERKIISAFEEPRGKRLAEEYDDDELNFQCRAWVAGEHNRRYGTDLRGSTSIQDTLRIGFDHAVGPFLSGIRAGNRGQREPTVTDVWPREYACPCPSGRTAGTEDTGAND
jgi:hypothetical protein